MSSTLLAHLYTETGEENIGYLSSFWILFLFFSHT